MARRHTDPATRLRDYSTQGALSPLGDHCIIWTGYVRPDGYGDMSIKGKLRRAHRVAYELTNGVIPEGMDVDHACHNVADCADGLDCMHRRCVNPNHLRLVTRGANARAGRTGESLTGVAGNICGAGHEMTEPNTIHAFGRRWCATCKRERGERLRWKSYA